MKAKTVVVTLPVVVLFEAILMELPAVYLAKDAIGGQEQSGSFSALVERNHGVHSMDDPVPVINRYLSPTRQTVRSKELNPSRLGVAFGWRFPSPQAKNHSDNAISLVLAPADSKVVRLNEAVTKAMLHRQFNSVRWCDLVGAADIKSTEVAQNQRGVGNEMAMKFGWREPKPSLDHIGIDCSRMFRTPTGFPFFVFESVKPKEGGGRRASER
jgi:hypothetical protein